MKEKYAYRNKIKSLVFDIETDEVSSAYTLRDQLEDKIKSRLISVIDEVFSATSINNFVSIDELSIDLGFIHTTEIDSELEERLRQTLTEALQDYIAEKKHHAGHEELDDISDESHSYDKRSDEWHETYFKTGLLPWWLDEDILDDVKGYFETWAKSNQQRLIQIISKNFTSFQVRKRFDSLFSRSFLIDVVQVDPIALWGSLSQLYEKLKFTSLFHSVNMTILWREGFESIRGILLNESKASSTLLSERQESILNALIQYISIRKSITSVELLIEVFLVSKDSEIRQRLSKLIDHETNRQTVTPYQWSHLRPQQIATFLLTQDSPEQAIYSLFKEQKPIISGLISLSKKIHQQFELSSYKSRELTSKMIEFMSQKLLESSIAKETFVREQTQRIISEVISDYDQSKLVKKLEALQEKKVSDGVKKLIQTAFEESELKLDKQAEKAIEEALEKELEDSVKEEETKPTLKLSPIEALLRYWTLGIVPVDIFSRFEDITDWVTSTWSTFESQEPTIKSFIQKLSLPALYNLISRAGNDGINLTQHTKLFENISYSLELISDSEAQSFSSKLIDDNKLYRFIWNKVLSEESVPFRPMMSVEEFIELQVKHHSGNLKELISDLSTVELIQSFLTIVKTMGIRVAKQFYRLEGDQYYLINYLTIERQGLPTILKDVLGNELSQFLANKLDEPLEQIDSKELQKEIFDLLNLVIDNRESDEVFISRLLNQQTKAPEKDSNIYDDTKTEAKPDDHSEKTRNEILDSSVKSTAEDIENSDVSKDDLSEDDSGKANLNETDKPNEEHSETEKTKQAKRDEDLSVDKESEELEVSESTSDSPTQEPTTDMEFKEELEETTRELPEIPLEEIEINEIVDPALEQEAQEVIESSIFINSAGVVLLGPYLPRLFGRLKLLDKKKSLTSLYGKQKALELMHYIVFGTDEMLEHHTVIFKILADLPITTPTPEKISLSDEEKELCDGMLKAIIANWPALKGSSIENLRASFLIREAKLTLEKSIYELHVEQKPFDMLLDKLPWSYRFIKFKWMDMPIQVEWR